MTTNSSNNIGTNSSNNIGYSTYAPNNAATTTTVAFHSIQPWVRILALTLTGIVIIGSIYCILWLYCHRKKRIVVSHQPELLLFVFIGILFRYTSIIPLSINESSVACLSYVWFYNIGFVITFAGLYSKLWRINKIFHSPQYRRVSVKVMDVIVPIVSLLIIMILLLLVLSIIDPPRWILEDSSNNDDAFVPDPTRMLQEESSNNDGTFGTTTTLTYGYCAVSGNVGWILMILIAILCFVTVVVTVYQAYMARNISSNFSETWPLALALLNWIQLAIIYYPLNSLLLDVVPSASYFLDVSVVIADSTSILLAVFLPLYLHPSIRSTPPTIIGSNVRIDQRVNPHPVVTFSTAITTRTNTVRDDEETIFDKVSDLAPAKEHPSNSLQLVATTTAVTVDVDKYKTESQLEI